MVRGVEHRTKSYPLEAVATTAKGGTMTDYIPNVSSYEDIHNAHHPNTICFHGKVKGVSPNAPIVVNEQGGKQSKTEYAFHLCDANAMLALAQVLQQGASKYERDNWRKIPSEEHFNHMVIHYFAWLQGDKSDEHLAHMFCRAMMLYATGKAEEQEDKPIELAR